MVAIYSADISRGGPVYASRKHRHYHGDLLYPAYTGRPLVVSSRRFPRIDYDSEQPARVNTILDVSRRAKKGLKPSRGKTKARVIGEKSLLCEPGSELRLAREKEKKNARR